MTSYNHYKSSHIFNDTKVPISLIKLIKERKPFAMKINVNGNRMAVT